MMMKKLDELGNMIGQQQRLMDQTYSEHRKQAQRQLGGSQPEGATSARAAGRASPARTARAATSSRASRAQASAARASSSQGKGLGEQQRALREELEKLKKSLDEMGAKSKELGTREESMKNAEQGLKQGDTSSALGDQSQALDQMRQGAQKMAEDAQKNGAVALRPERRDAARSAGPAAALPGAGCRQLGEGARRDRHAARARDPRGAAPPRRPAGAPADGARLLRAPAAPLLIAARIRCILTSPGGEVGWTCEARSRVAAHSYACIRLTLTLSPARRGNRLATAGTPRAMALRRARQSERAARSRPDGSRPSVEMCPPGGGSPSIQRFNCRHRSAPSQLPSFSDSGAS